MLTRLLHCLTVMELESQCGYLLGYYHQRPVQKENERKPMLLRFWGESIYISTEEYAHAVLIKPF